MITKDQKKLLIFENFIVDKNLPKYKRRKTLNKNFEFSNQSDFTFDSGIEEDVSEIWGSSPQPLTIETVNTTITKKSIFNIFSKRKKKKEKIKYRLTINDFFHSVKNSTQEIKKIDNRVEGYEEALKQAQTLGQTALVEKLLKMIEIVHSETQLYTMGLKQFISEEQIVDFYKDSEKGMKLLWIKNFIRVIPSKFVDLKKELDEKGVFDNYVVLTYDPDEKSYAETKEEEEKRKDPILFGVINGSDKLYYIGDWIDEFCDLTLEKFIDKFGKKAIQKNNLKAKLKIDEFLK